MQQPIPQLITSKRKYSEHEINFIYEEIKSMDLEKIHSVRLTRLSEFFKDTPENVREIYNKEKAKRESDAYVKDKTNHVDEKLNSINLDDVLDNIVKYTHEEVYLRTIIWRRR